MGQLGWVIVDCIWVHKKGTFTCIALSDSWATGDHMPTVEQIATLRYEGDATALADNEPNMWWMDLNSRC